MSEFTIYLKTGDKFTFIVESFSVTYSTIDGTVTGFKYKNPAGLYPLFIDVSQIAAVTAEKL